MLYRIRNELVRDGVLVDQEVVQQRRVAGRRLLQDQVDEALQGVHVVAVAVGQLLPTLQLAELGERDVVVQVVREDAWRESNVRRTLLGGVVVHQGCSIALLQPCLAPSRVGVDDVQHLLHQQQQAVICQAARFIPLVLFHSSHGSSLIPMYKYSINTIQDRSACTSSVNYFYYSSKVLIETHLKKKVLVNLVHQSTIYKI